MPRRLDLGRRAFVIRQVLIVAVAICVYFGVRGVTVGKQQTAEANALDIVALERRLGLYQESEMQALLHGRDWLVDFSNWIYIWGHWPVIITVMFWLAARHRKYFLRLRNAMLISGGLGLIAFAAYPVSPPRLAGLGLIDTVTEHSQAYRILQPTAFVNPYAAMPSLHVGWDLLVGITVFSAASLSLARWFGVVMPILMAFAVVLTANHYIVDGLAGAALALLGLAAAVAIERRQQRQTRRPQLDLPRPREGLDQRIGAAYRDMAS